MVRVKILVLIIFLFFILSCGTDYGLKPVIEKPTSGIIQNLRIENNVLSFDTKDSTYVALSFVNRIDPDDKYKGWSAGKAKLNHVYLIPVEEPALTYQMKLSVYYNESFQDTVITFTSTYANHPFMKVHFIDVGQGDAILVQTADNKNIQIDGGYGTRGNSLWQGGGQPLALNYLIQNNITHLDYIIETHRHADHYGGLNDIIASNISYGRYISPRNPYIYQPGMTLELESSTEFIFFNIGYPQTYNGSSVNNTSIVLKAIYGDAEFLFTGDAEGPVQDWMFSQCYDLSSDVLKVSHHGSSSNDTSSALFLSATLNQFAKIAILTFGTGNPYNHPHSLPRFANFQTYGTGLPVSIATGNNYNFNCGTIKVITDGSIIYVTTER